MDLFSEQTQIEGLRYIPNFISEGEEAELLAIIDQQEWLTDLKRRVQHYGWKYDYKSRRVSANLCIGELPEWLRNYSQRLINAGFAVAPEQVIINEYQAGQGISAHIDIPAFGATIASLSLGSGCMMDFANAERKESLWLEPRSLVLLSGEARYKWKHSISARKSDKMQGVTIPRARRVSLTFRTISQLRD